MTKVTAIGLLVLVAVPAMADTEIPEEWIGIWELDIEVYDCETNGLLFSSTTLDTICPGSVFEDPDPGEVTIECTGSADANSYTTNCEGSEEVTPGCTMNFVYEISGTRNSNSYTSTGTTTITYTGDCPLIPDSCQRVEITGTRTSTDPGPCEATPVESRLWSTVKSYYR
jgi:hypothetical protein